MLGFHDQWSRPSSRRWDAISALPKIAEAIPDGSLEGKIVIAAIEHAAI
jgi:hypothetical protein